MDADVQIRSVEEVQTRTGKTRFVVTDEDGREYTTFRPAVGRDAARFEGRRARIEFHEEDRNGFHNVYLDAIHPAPAAEPAGDGTDAEEAAWTAAVEAAPWLLGEKEPEREVPPDELYERLEPFKSLVARDIREHSDGDGAGDAERGDGGERR